MKISILVSGSGTNLQNIIDAIENGLLANVEINTVIADRDCYALERALGKDLITYQFDRDSQLFEEINDVIPIDTDLIILGGFLSILSEDFCIKWAGKIINIHPSLLPKYGGKGMYGKYVHQAVLANNEKETGATVHFVTYGIDEGEIILQKKINIKEGETADFLAVRVHEIEKQILPEAILLLVQKNKNK